MSIDHPVRQDAPPTDLPWRDNAFLAFWSHATDVFGVVHVSTSPNAEGRRARASLSVGGLEAEVVEPLQPGTFRSDSIHFDLDGRIEVDHRDLGLALTLTPDRAVGDYSASGVIPALVPGRPLQHLQQCSLVSGTASVRARGREETAAVAGAGLRDRTWGYRDESAAFVEYAAAMLDLGDDFATVMKFKAPDGKLTMHGFLLGAEAAPLDSLVVTRDAAGLTAGLRFGATGRSDIEVRRLAMIGGFWVPMGVERTGPTFSAFDEFVLLEGGGAGVVEQGVLKTVF